MKLNYFTGISVLSFVMGYALYRTSNLRKDEFRKNPVSPIVPCKCKSEQWFFLFFSLLIKTNLTSLLEIYRFGDHPDVAWKEIDGVRFMGLCETSQLFGWYYNAMVYREYWLDKWHSVLLHGNLLHISARLQSRERQ